MNSENFGDLIRANLADVLVEPYLRAVNIARLVGPPMSERWAKLAGERYKLIADARERGSVG